MLDKNKKDALREALIEFLAGRSCATFTVSLLAGTNGVRKLIDFSFEDTDIAEALAVLTGLGFVEEVRLWGSSIKEYRITDDGAKMRYERTR